MIDIFIKLFLWLMMASPILLIVALALSIRLKGAAKLWAILGVIISSPLVILFVIFMTGNFVGGGPG